MLQREKQSRNCKGEGRCPGVWFAKKELRPSKPPCGKANEHVPQVLH